MSNDRKTPLTQWIYRLLLLELAVIFFLIPAGRFHASLFGHSFTFGGDVYKNFPYLLITWLAWKYLRRDPSFSITPLHLPLALFFIASFLSSLGSPDPYQAFSETLEFLFYIAFFIILIDIPWTLKTVTFVSSSFFLGNLWMGGVALSQFFSNMISSGFSGINATFQYPNFLGIYSILGLTLFAFLYEYAESQRQKRCAMFGISITIACALLTVTRATYIGLITWLLVYFSMSRKLTLINKLAFIGALLIVILSNPVALTKFKATFQELKGETPYSRILIWPFVMDYGIPDMPFFGYGKGPVLRNQMDSELIAHYEPHYLTRYWKSHNLYLHLFLSMGILGLFAFFYIIASYIKMIYDTHPRSLPIFLAGIIAYLVHHLFEISFMDGNVPATLFALFAITALSTRFHQTNSSISYDHV